MDIDTFFCSRHIELQSNVPAFEVLLQVGFGLRRSVEGQTDKHNSEGQELTHLNLLCL